MPRIHIETSARGVQASCPACRRSWSGEHGQRLTLACPWCDGKGARSFWRRHDVARFAEAMMFYFWGACMVSAFPDTQDAAVWLVVALVWMVIHFVLTYLKTRPYRAAEDIPEKET